MELTAYSDEALAAILRQAGCAWKDKAESSAAEHIASAEAGEAVGSTEAFELLLARMAPFIHARVSAYAGKQAGSHAREDLFQEAMLGFLSAVDTYRPEGGASFRTYMTVCVNHRIISALRRGTCRRDAPLDPEELLPPGSAAMDPQDIFSAMEETRRMMEVIQARLTPLERSVMEQYLAGSRYDEIALSLHVTAKAVDNALQRVRKKLRQFL